MGKEQSTFKAWWEKVKYASGNYYVGQMAGAQLAWDEATRQAIHRHAEDLALCAEQATRALEQDRERARLDAVRIADLEREVTHHRAMADGWKAEAKRCASQLAQALEMDQEHIRLANERLAELQETEQSLRTSYSSYVSVASSALAAEQAKVTALEARLVLYDQAIAEAEAILGGEYAEHYGVFYELVEAARSVVQSPSENIK